MNELKMRFKKDRMFRMMVYGLALVLTFVNCPLVTRLASGALSHASGGMKVYLIIQTAILGGVTLGLYYVSNGIGAFVLVTSFLTKIAAGFTAVMAALTSWALGLGVLLQLILPPMIIAGGVFMGIALAMAFPAVFVPLMATIARLGDREMEEEEILKKGLRRVHERQE